MRKPAYNYIEEYLNEVQTKGRYSVTLNEIKNRFTVSEKALLQNIYRLKKRNRLAQVRKEFYVIIPPQYSNRGMLPPTLFIADMMDFINRKYYVALLSAAALHGAGHQQPMEFQIITTKPPLRNINNQKLKISFFVKNIWQSGQIEERKTESGYIEVSSPELTAFDLVQYHTRIGGLNRVIPILEDLAEIIKPASLFKTAKNQKISNIQRLGYLFDGLSNQLLSDSLHKSLSVKLKNIPISLAHKNITGIVNKKWRVIINTELDF